MKDARISGHFDTKYMIVLRMEQILHNFEDQKFANLLNLEQVNFRVTLVMYVLRFPLYPDTDEFSRFNPPGKHFTLISPEHDW